MDSDSLLPQLKRQTRTRWAVFLFLGLNIPGGASAGPIEDLNNAGPQAAALLYSKAPSWRSAPQVVKDRAGFMIFEKDFPNKKEMSIDDMTACIDKAASTAPDSTAVNALVNDCSG
jgi:hypothetical protein